MASFLCKEERVRNQCQNKWNKDFLTKTGFLRKLFIIINKKLDQIISNLLIFSKCFSYILIATFCFEMWNIFWHISRYFIIDNNYSLLITFQQVDVYLNEPFETHELIKLDNQSNLQVKGALVIERVKITTTLIREKK